MVKRKTSMVILLFLVAGSYLMTSYGMIFITSNIVHVNSSLQVDLTYTVIGHDKVKLNAIVTNNGNPIRNATVNFYYSTAGTSSWNLFDTDNTNGRGLAQTTYTITANGEYTFKAIVVNIP